MSATRTKDEAFRAAAPYLAALVAERRADKNAATAPVAVSADRVVPEGATSGEAA